MKKIILILFIAILMFIGFKLVNSKKQEQANQPTAFIQKQLPKIENQQELIEEQFEYFQAKVEALQNPKITTKISGYIQNIEVKENQEVKQGDILVGIDSQEFEQNLQQLSYTIGAIQSSIESLNLSLESLKLDSILARNQYQTNQKLYKIGGISKEKLDLSQIIYKQKESKYLSTLENIKAKELELQSAQSSFAAKESLKSYYTLKAPIDAKVEKIMLDTGDLANSNQPILSLISKEKKLVFSYASDTIRQNQEVFISEEKIGFIEYINPSSENFLQVANIKLMKNLDLPNNSLLSIKVKVK